MSIIQLLAGIANSIAGFLRLKSSMNVQRREAEKDVATLEAKVEEKTAMIKESVYTQNDEKLNEIVLDLMRPAVAIMLGVWAIGCSAPPKTVYVPTDRRIESCTNSIGIACKAVPDAVMVDMLEKLQELKDLKTEKKVDHRVGQ